jgi:hypothetical protein
MAIRFRVEVTYDFRSVSERFAPFLVGADNSPAATKIVEEWFSVAASASDEAISIIGETGVKYVILEDLNDSGKLTCKINGSANATSINHIVVLSEDLTSISVSSSDTANAQQFRVITILD